MCIAPEWRQRGVVLVFTLLVLLMLGLLVTTLMRGSVMQLRMARSLEASALERQLALGEIERLLAHQGNSVPEGGPGFRHCTPDVTFPGCDTSTLPPGSGLVPASVEVLREGRPPPRLEQSRASSGVAHRALRYEVAAVAGHTTLVQGVLVMYPERNP